MRFLTPTTRWAITSLFLLSPVSSAQDTAVKPQTAAKNVSSYDASVPAPTISEIKYGPHQRQVLDFWQAKSETPTPVVFVIHGGGWQGGEKERIDRFADVGLLLKAGISVAAINYRFIKQAESDGITPPVKAPLHDAARALQFVRSQASQWNIDKQRIGAAGGSAGACSSLWLAFHDDLADPSSDDPVARESSRLWCAAVTGAQTTLDPQQMREWTPNSRYGGHAFGLGSFAEFLAQRESILPLIAEFSPYALVTRDDPQVYLIYSAPPALGQEQKDPTHTSNFGVKLQEHCAAMGVACELNYPGATDVKHQTPTDYLIGTLTQGSPYGNAPPVKPPYYRVRYAAGSQPGELVYPVAYTVWIPPELKTLRGIIVHQHGCGEGSCKSGQTGAFDLHWQALASKHNCALLSPAYEQPDGADCQLWCDPRHGSDARFQQALADLGSQTGHPEMSSVPWALWGHSGGGHWAGGMLMLHPEKVAAVWLRSGVPLFEKLEGRDIEPHSLNPLALRVPVMCNLGTKEGFSENDGKFAGVWPSNQAFVAKLRGAGGLVGLAVDPLTSHECGNQRYLAMPWFDACLAARLPTVSHENLSPTDPSESKPRQPSRIESFSIESVQEEPFSITSGGLKRIDPRQGWLAPLPSPSTVIVPPVPANDFSGEMATAIWLPNQHIAEAWTQFVHDAAIADDSPPPAPTDIRLVGNELSWNATADLQSGLSHFIIESGGVEIARVEGPKHRFGRSLFQGLQYSDTPATPLVEMRYQLDSDQLAPASRFRIRSVNTVGAKSE